VDVEPWTAQLTRLSDVPVEPIDYLWPGRIARGKYTLLGGDPGTGKTRVMCDVTARITNGLEWPDGGRAPRGKVLFIAAEDGLGDTLRPAIEQMGGDVNRVEFLEMRQGAVVRPVNLKTDLNQIERVMMDFQPALVIIDPIASYLGETNSFKDSEVRGLLTPFLGVLARSRTALVGIAHLTKDDQKAAIYRPGGSIAFIAMARLSMLVMADPLDTSRRLLVALKQNICKPIPGRAFRIGDRGLEWEQNPISLDAQSLLDSRASGQPRPRARHAGVKAEGFLLALLADGPQPHRVVQQRSRDEGISDATLKRAKDKLGIESKFEGFGHDGTWFWQLPADDESTCMENGEIP
jgi:hypothetical protein